MSAKIFGYVGMGVLTAALAVTVHSTIALAQVDLGLNRSLDSTKQLAGIEQTIIQKNKALTSVLATAKGMNTQIAQTLQTTQGIDQNIRSINRLNRATLEKNLTMVQQTGSSKQSLQAIAANAQSLATSIHALQRYLETLDQVTAADRANLAAMQQDTATMNSKVPGVTN